MFVFVILSLIVLSLYLFLKQKYSYWERKGVPGPKPNFFVGNTGQAILMNTMLSDICHKLYKEYKDYAYVGLFNLMTPVVLVRDLDLIKDVLIKQFNNFHDNWIQAEDEVDPIIARNPFLLRGNEWKVLRTQLTPQYTSAKVKGSIPLMQDVANNLINYINNQTETKKSNCFEVKELSARFTGDNTLLCGYGLEGKSFIDEVPIAFKIGEEIANPALTVQIKQIISFFFPGFFRKLFKVTFLGCPVPKTFWDMILSTMKYRDENNIVRKDYLDFIRNLRNPNASPYEVTDAYAVAHAFTLFLDAFETSANAIAFTLYELTQNLEIQARARQEIDQVLNKYNGKLSYEALCELEYIDNIVHESLRKHPIILFLSRICTEDFVFPPPKGVGKDVLIKKGTIVFLPVYSIHHDPQYYPDPEKFDPDRFTEGGKASRPKSSFLGFGDGPRICLGRNFAMQQIKVLLIVLLNKFEVRMNSKTTVPYVKDRIQVLNIPKDGVFINFNKRSQ